MLTLLCPQYLHYRSSANERLMGQCSAVYPPLSLPRLCTQLLVSQAERTYSFSQCTAQTMKPAEQDSEPAGELPPSTLTPPWQPLKTQAFTTLTMTTPDHVPYCIGTVWRTVKDYCLLRRASKCIFSWQLVCKITNFSGPLSVGSLTTQSSLLLKSGMFK